MTRFSMTCKVVVSALLLIAIACGNPQQERLAPGLAEKLKPGLYRVKWVEPGIDKQVDTLVRISKPDESGLKVEWEYSPYALYASPKYLEAPILPVFLGAEYEKKVVYLNLTADYEFSPTQSDPQKKILIWKAKSQHGDSFVVLTFQAVEGYECGNHPDATHKYRHFATSMKER